MKKMFGAVAGVGLALLPAVAMAEGVSLTEVDLDTDTVVTLAGTVLGGLGVIWGIRKVIKLINRS